MAAPLPGRTRLAWIYDARTLVWLLALVFLTGTPLMVVFDTDPARHASALAAWRPWGHILRATHAASSSLLVVGVLGHLSLRLRPLWQRPGARGEDDRVRGTGSVPRARPSRAGVKSGALAMASVALAAITGAMITQTAAAERLLAWGGLAGVARITLWVAVVHIAYATILVLMTVYFHIARWGWGYVFASWSQATSATAGTALLALLLGSTVPGSDAVWEGSTWLAVPPVPVLWGWTVIASVAVWLFAGRVAAGRSDGGAEQAR